jgi:DNA-binding MarR family transcriptional regulator
MQDFGKLVDALGAMGLYEKTRSEAERVAVRLSDSGRGQKRGVAARADACPILRHLDHATSSSRRYPLAKGDRPDLVPARDRCQWEAVLSAP